VSSETVPQRSAKQITSSFDNRALFLFFFGLVTIGIWIGTAVMLLTSVRATLDGTDYSKCGTVVTFDRAKEATDYDDSWAVACEGAVDLRAREALSIGLISVPLAALWVYLASQQPRLANDLKRAEALESDSKEAKRAEAGAAESENSE
jgi:hypothetical protein